MKEKKQNFFIPSIAHHLFLVIFLIMSLSPVGKQMLTDADTGYHIRAGDYILDNHFVPKHDIFSYHSPPISWTAHEWLSEVVMALLHQAAGLTGVVLFFVFLISLTYALLFHFMRIHGRNIIVDVLIVLFVVLSSQIHWLARPHIFSLLFMVIWHHILIQYQCDRAKCLYLLPPTMLIWVNLHGGYLTGFILTGTYLLGNLVTGVRLEGEERERAFRKVKMLGYVVIACLLVSLLNPAGYRILFFPFRLVTETYIMDNVGEFLSPNFHKPIPFKYLLLTLICILAVSRKPLDFIEVVLVLLFTNMSLFSARYIPLFAIIVAPILSGQAESLLNAVSGSRWVSSLEKRGRRIASIDSSARGSWWPAAAVILVLILVSTGQVEFVFDDRIKPVAAVEFLKREHIDGRMYNNDEWGDYLIYASFPRYKVFFDGRSDMYGTARMKEFQKIAWFGPGWEKIVEKYDIRWFFIGSDSLLTRYLLEKPDWQLIYSDNVTNIHVRNSEEYRYLIERYKDVTPVVPEEEEEEK